MTVAGGVQAAHFEAQVDEDSGRQNVYSTLWHDNWAHHKLNENWRYVRQFAFKPRYRRFTDDSSVRYSEFRAKPSVSLGFNYDSKTNWSTFGLLELSTTQGISGREIDDDTDLELDLLYGTYRGTRLDLRVGRQSLILEPRKWLFGKEMDGVHAYFQINQHHGINLAMGRSEFFRTDLFEETPFTDRDVFALQSTWGLPGDRRLNLTASQTEETSGTAPEELRHLTLSTYGELTKSSSYWLYASRLDGNRNDVKLKGWGLDLGMLRRFKKSSLYIGFAHGSGDSNPDALTDETFQQTSFHDNSDEFDGLETVNYYGNVLQPELSNLNVLTIGAGYKPSSDLSFDLTYHRYWQDVPANPRFIGQVDSTLTGLDDDIGDGLDLTIGLKNKPLEESYISFTLGMFKPGDAFVPDSRKNSYHFLMEFYKNF